MSEAIFNHAKKEQNTHLQGFNPNSKAVYCFWVDEKTTRTLRQRYLANTIHCKHFGFQCILLKSFDTLTSNNIFFFNYLSNDFIYL